METMTTLSVINLLPSTKEQIDMFISKTVDEIKCGNVNALQLKAQLKCFEKVAEGIDKATKNEQLTERMKYKEKVVEIYGAKIEIAEVGTKYDYSACNDLEWNNLDAKIKKLSEKKKDRETFLKALSKPMAMADEHTGGEMIMINPPLKTSTTSLKFTI